MIYSSECIKINPNNNNNNQSRYQIANINKHMIKVIVNSKENCQQKFPGTYKE